MQLELWPATRPEVSVGQRLGKSWELPTLIPPSSLARVSLLSVMTLPYHEEQNKTKPCPAGNGALLAALQRRQRPLLFSRCRAGASLPPAWEGPQGSPHQGLQQARALYLSLMK